MTSTSSVCTGITDFRRCSCAVLLAVQEVVVLDMWSAVQLSFDPLGVGVRRQLLSRPVRDQEEGVVLRVRNAELEGAHLADFLGGGVGVHLQRLGRAAAVHFLQRHPQVVL